LHARTLSVRPSPRALVSPADAELPPAPDPATRVLFITPVRRAGPVMQAFGRISQNGRTESTGRVMSRSGRTGTGRVAPVSSSGWADAPRRTGGGEEVRPDGSWSGTGSGGFGSWRVQPSRGRRRGRDVGPPQGVGRGRRGCYLRHAGWAVVSPLCDRTTACTGAGDTWSLRFPNGVAPAR
jgi:hypothetical protein